MGHRSSRTEGLKSIAWQLFSAIDVFWTGGNNVPCCLAMDRGERVFKTLHLGFSDTEILSLSPPNFPFLFYVFISNKVTGVCIVW